jgi:TonB family protein
MRSMIMMTAAACMAAGAALAANGPDQGAKGVNLLQKPAWANAPSAAEIAAAYPKAARADKASGQAVIRCWLGKTGTLDNCVVASETPGGQGFGGAALSLASKFRVLMEDTPKDVAGPVLVDVPVAFEPPGEARTIASPDWLRVLPQDKVQQVFPPKAADAGLSTGRAVLDCVADAQGSMTGCQVVSEDPSGMDFGPAALRVAQAMGVNPWTDDGHPADGAHVRFALRLNKAAR